MAWLDFSPSVRYSLEALLTLRETRLIDCDIEYLERYVRIAAFFELATTERCQYGGPGGFILPEGVTPSDNPQWSTADRGVVHHLTKSNDTTHRRQRCRHRQSPIDLYRHSSTSIPTRARRGLCLLYCTSKGPSQVQRIHLLNSRSLRTAFSAVSRRSTTTPLQPRSNSSIPSRNPCPA
jgi:hypothetical protein